MRVFFAIIPPKTVCDFLTMSIATLKKGICGHFVQWTPTNHLHVTLQFLKSLQPTHLIPLTELVRLQLKNIPSFQLQLGHLTAFPTPENPKIIALTVEPYKVLMTLSNTIGQAMGILGYPAESRPFQGHITLARLHHDKLQPDLLSLTHFPITLPILINEIYLIESKFDKEGAHYIPLAQFELNCNQLNL